MASEFAALLREPTTVTVAGVRVSLPYRPAAVWASGLDRLHVLASLLADPADRDKLAEAVLSSPDAMDQLKDESLRVLGEQGQRPWWEVGRLLRSSASGEILGRLVLAGVDPWQRSVGEWTAAVYAIFVKDQDEKGRAKFDFTLSLPPPGYEDQWDDGIDDIDALASQYARALGK